MGKRLLVLYSGDLEGRLTLGLLGIGNSACVRVTWVYKALLVNDIDTLGNII